MTQKLISLSQKTKGVIIPNTMLKQLNNPDAFEMVIQDGKIVLNPLTKKENNNSLIADQSIDLYKID